MTHDTNAGGGLARLTLNDCGSVNLAAGWDCASTRQTTITGHYSPQLMSRSDTSSHIAGGGNFPIEVARSLLGGSNALFRWVDNASIRVTSSALLCSGSFSGAGLTTMGRGGSIAVEDSFMVAADNVAPPFIDLAIGTLGNNRNVAIGAANVFVLGSVSGIAISSDANIHKPFTGIAGYCNVAGRALTLPEWRVSSGADVSTQSVVTAAEAGFASGNFPTPLSPDLNLAPGGRAATVMRNPLTPAEVTGMQARPTTLAQAKAYLLNSAPSRRAVRD